MLKLLKRSLSSLLAGSNKKIELSKMAIVKALSTGVPFVAYSLPSTSTIDFFADCGDNISSVNTQFSITPWGAKSSAIIKARSNVPDFLAAKVDCFQGIFPKLQPSTSYMNYSNSVGHLIEELKQDGGKCVISRIESYNVMSGLSPEDIAEIAVKVLTDFVKEFAYIFHHPEVGTWLAASPEKLFCVDKPTGKFQTIALAGTRVASKNEDWDSKNVKEHAYVVDFIDNILKSTGVSFTKKAPTTLSAGKIEHIVTSFEGELKGGEASEIINELHPTPAIAGFPRSKALMQINKFESHQRRCYSGLVTLETPKLLLSYVNLRCAEISADSVAFYAGGGITADSEVDTEWRECARKMSTLMPYFFPTE
ncbi:MAG: chorismate-binding protein [Muribaculaceae bacterium]|nr:chorismate-binding protein [Muribaculaceae bacterium]